MLVICYVLLGFCLLLLLFYIIETIKAHIWLNVFIKLENYKVDLDSLRKYNVELSNKNDEKR